MLTRLGVGSTSALVDADLAQVTTAEEIHHGEHLYVWRKGFVRSSDPVTALDKGKALREVAEQLYNNEKSYAWSVKFTRQWDVKEAYLADLKGTKYSLFVESELARPPFQPPFNVTVKKLSEDKIARLAADPLLLIG